MATVAPRPVEPFVGRSDLIALLIAALAKGPARIRDTYGVQGIGKTTLLNHLRAAAEGTGALAEPIEMADYNPECAGERGHEASTWALSATCSAFRNLLVDLAETLSARGDREARGFDGFANTVRVAKNTRRKVELNVHNTLNANNARFRNSDVQNVNVEYTEAEASLRDAIMREGDDIANGFVHHFNGVAALRGVLLTVDGYEQIADQELAAWLNRLALRLKNTLIVVARSPNAQPMKGSSERLERHALPRFGRDEVQMLLEASLPDQPIEAAVVDAVVDFSAGHPATVALVAELLQRLPPVECNAAAVSARLRATDDEFRRDLAQLVDAILAVDGGDLGEALTAAAIPRRFDGLLLDTLLGGDGCADRGELLARLEGYSFVEPVPGSVGVFRVHGFISTAIEARLTHHSLQRWRSLHRLAAEHWFQLMKNYEEREADGTEKGYEAWYRYEDAAWQAHMREWLYHRRRLAGDNDQGDDAKLARLQFANVFFEAFFWWGCYLDFPFCRDLIDEWARTQLDDRPFTAALSTVLASYPTGYRKEGSPGWQDVEDALLFLRDECVHGAPESLDRADERHLRALIDIFLAHTHRYRAATLSPDDYRVALRYYDEAERLLAADDDSWSLAWVGFEKAELHSDASEPEEAKAPWRAAAAPLLAGEFEDEELKANLHRLAADLLWAEGNRERAMEEQGLAILHGYLFQNQPHPPDDYTRAFYVEQLERAAARVDAAGEGAEHMRRAFGDTAGDGFPEPPGADELLDPASVFLKRWRRVNEELGESAASDLEGVL
jgi:hypothetical protein